MLRSRPTCIFCESAHQSALGINPDFDQCTVFYCANCKAIYSAPVPTEDELAAIYESKYRQIRKEKPTEKYLSVMRKRAEAQRNFVMPFVRGKGRCLDIGSGAGTLLEAFAKDFTALEGYEPDTAMFNESERRRSHNVRFYNSLCNVEKLQPNSFDLITLSHVFEHIAEPRKFLISLVDKLSDSGIIFIEVPNENVNIVREQCLFSPKGTMHLNYFNRASFRNLFGDICEILHIKEFGVSNRYFRKVPPNRRDLWRYIYYAFYKSAPRIASKFGLLDIRSQAAIAGSFETPNSSGIYLRIILTKRS